MADQTLVQIRVDTQLKEQAAEVFEKIGIDIPTAVRMFFKATVREQALPFSTNVAVERPIQTEAEQIVNYFKGLIIYDPPISDDNSIVVLPLENGRNIPAAMFVQLVTKVPAGQITCWEDIFETLGNLYGQSVTQLPDRSLPKLSTDNVPIPYWRVVSQRGILGDGLGGSRETQKEKLMDEGLSVVQRGSIAGSYKIEDYKERMFNYATLKVVKSPDYP